jgi:hypothetical protein
LKEEKSKKSLIKVNISSAPNRVRVWQKDKRAPLKLDIKIRLKRRARPSEIIKAIRAAGRGEPFPSWLEITLFDWTHGEEISTRKSKAFKASDIEQFGSYLERASMVVEER